MDPPDPGYDSSEVRYDAMMNNELYDAIFHRKSVRRFEAAALPESTIEEIVRFAGSAMPLHGDPAGWAMGVMVREVPNRSHHGANSPASMSQNLERSSVDGGCWARHLFSA